MKIVILGAGQVGSTVAESLVSEANDITIVDMDGDRLRNLADHLDLRTVEGNAAHPSILRAAGADDADLILAVTQSDQTNMVACKLAATLFHVPTRIARIRSQDYLGHPEVFEGDNFAIDVTICPEQIVTDYITKLIEFPESLQVVDFANGRVRLVAVKAFTGGPMVGHPLSDIRKHIPEVDSRVAAIFRGDSPLIPTGDTVIEHGDEVFFLAARENIRTVLRELRRMDRPVRRVMIAGGGNIGSRLAKALESSYQVKLIELNKRAGERLSEELDSTLILIGDSTDEELLETEHVGEMDVFCALTNDDENNIMSSLLAKRMGARRVITLINRSAYVDLVHGGQIDIAISPANTTIGALLAHVRRGDCAAVHSLRRGAAEALEIIAHGDTRSSKVVGRRVEDIALPRGATIAAIVRRAVPSSDDEIACPIGADDTVIIAHHDTVIEKNDHVIVFAVSKQLVPKIEKLFSVGVGFF
ncbi:MAG: Trk system potassium transporter TrkA [Rhodocyclaceae bacterium]|nr:Trk system potassium transporter TrkA [Rhodocyclaceae bacterium]MCA3091146.1 Trk system potassium transporter TrkA [Rhodocyclaceae bacterium]MCA3092308.1 Trk system potassium transporter TrkA [Rhodocyclaceae bacterium]MCA3098489.1 Trk system potassium transporter TrkA [Rhodocyclaceae bacterium]MCA3102089.1 Trk system potassium transporter TrkA [Rhodocyclaceae bacterium]